MLVYSTLNFPYHQVLSETVAKALEDEGHSETAKFVENFDKFFDCLNVSCITGGRDKNKKFRYPYRTANDDRLKVRLIAYMYIVYAKFLCTILYIVVVRKRFSWLPATMGGKC